MPLSRYEEGVNPHAWHSSDSIAGVPIKKRRFPLIRPPSPPPETTLQQEHDKGKINTKQESSSPNAGGPKEVSGFAFSNNRSSPNKVGEHSTDRDANLVQSNVNCGLNLHDQASVSDIGQNQKGMRFPGHTELQLSPFENRVQTVVSKAELTMSDKSNFSNIPASTELLLAPKEPLRIAVAGATNEGNCKEHEKLDPFKWNLGLSKGQNCSNDNDVKMKNNCTKRTNRSHWDLNTTMETWEESLNDAATAHGTGGMDILGASSAQDIKPAICTKQVIVNDQRGTRVGLGKKILDISEQHSKLSSLLKPVEQVSRSDDLLYLRLQSSLVPQSPLSAELSHFPTEVDSRRAQPNLSLSNVSVAQSKVVQHRFVKPEPVDEGSRPDLVAKVVPPKFVDHGIIKPEPFQGCFEESHKSSINSVMEILKHRAVKSEPNQTCNQENVKSVKGMLSHTEIHTGHSELPVYGEVSNCSDVPIPDTVMPTTRDLSHPFKFPTTTRLPKSERLTDDSLLPTCTNEVPICAGIGQEVSNAIGFVASGLVSLSASSDSKEPKVAADMSDVPRTESLGNADPEQSISNSKGDVQVDSLGNGEVAESDEEKVNISADEEFSYDTDYESDGYHAIGSIVDTEDKQHQNVDDEYEDGEVREPSVHSETEDGVYAEGEEAEHVDGRSTNDATSDNIIATSEVDDRDAKTEETRNADSSEQSDNILSNDQAQSEDALPQEPLPLELLTVGSETKPPSDALQRQELDLSGAEDNIKDSDAVLPSDIVLSISEGTASKDGMNDVINQHEDVNRTNSLGTSCSGLSKTEPCGSSDETAKDVNGKGSRSRIITLPRASNPSLSGGTKPIPSRMLPSRSEGERFTDVVFGSDKSHARGSRDERYMDHRFERKRTRDQPFGSTGSDFRFGRGRADNRLRTKHYDWDSSHDFSAGQSNGPTGFRFPRSKNPASAKLEGSGFIVARGGTSIGAGRGRGGRKPLNDELPNFRHPTSRRRSPGGREGPMPRGVQMVRRPRDISPERCISGDGPDLVGLRHDEKFMRGLTSDMRNTVFSRPQPQFERVDDTFIRGDRSFSPMQRRVPLHIPRVRSKSPPRSRTRSPGPWSSPRRRSPDEFVGHPELTRCRSPRVYRMERMRSPHQLPCFTEEMVVRRHGSPPYMSRLCNDMREIGSSREHDRPRSFIPNRSPSGRILPRNTRRFNMVDPRERTENNEFFVGEMPPGRFHELVTDEGVDGRRKCIERRGPVRPFRPPYNGSDVENFHHDEEDDTRPFRFCPEVDAEFRERGNLRERGGFDRRMKSRPENPPRRTRSIEEQEENYWQNGQVWHDTDFDDVSHMKRRRF